MRNVICLVLPLLLFCSCKKNGGASVSPKIANSTAPVSTESTTTLSFSGYTWTVKNSSTGELGPGPNNWKGANAYVDSNGYLHLKITKVGAKWYCAEVKTTQNFGYGKYQFWVDGRIDQLDTNVIFGMFNYSGVDGIDEMDIEYGTFGGTRPNSGFTVYPSQSVGGPEWHSGFNTTLEGSSTTHRFTRNGTSSVFFQEIGGFYNDDSHVIDTMRCKNPPNSISSVAMPIFINLWLYKGRAPVNNLPAEIIVRQFKFTPL